MPNPSSSPSRQKKKKASPGNSHGGDTATDGCSLNESAKALLQEFVDNHESSGEHLAVDVWRVLQEEAQLMYETQCIRDLLDQDPFQCYQDRASKAAIENFKRSLQVISCHRLEMANNYCLTEATVRCQHQHTSRTKKATSSPTQKKAKLSGDNKLSQSEGPIQLHFKYERLPATPANPTRLWYSIDLSLGYDRPKENLLVIRVWADDNKPSRLPAVDMDDVAEHDDEDDDDSCWEDIGSEEEQDNDEFLDKKRPSKKSSRKRKSAESKQEDEISSGSVSGSVDEQTGSEDSSKENRNEQNKEEEEEESRDRYACYLDPDVLQMFLEATHLTTLDEAAAFFALMTFPYYQHEWDLVAFFLDSVFGCDDEEVNDGETAEKDE